MSFSKTNRSNWFPVRYYTPSLEEPEYSSSVQVDSTGTSVVAQALAYSSSFPLLLVNSSNPVVVREYICGRYVEKYTEDVELELRWMQRFRVPAEDNDATWMIDDIKIRIWNGTCFLDLLDEDFSTSYSDINDKYSLRAADVREPSCGSPGSGSALYMSNASPEGSPTTRRSIIFKQNINDIPESCEEMDSRESK